MWGSGSRSLWPCVDIRSQAWPEAMKGHLLLSHHSQRLQGQLLLGLALPGASQGPLESWRQILSTCWGPLDSWYCRKTWTLRGQLRLARLSPAISESLLVNIPPLHALLAPLRAAVQEPVRYFLEGEIRKDRGSHDWATKP